MKCYDFELNISAYIEGHLQQVVRKEFNKHKETCNHCSEKLKDISQLMNEMPKMTSLTTSNEFIHNLNIKIQEIDNQKPSFWERLKQVKPIGFEPVPALGFTLAMFLVIGSAYLLMDSWDVLPEMTDKPYPRTLEPSSIVNPPQAIPQTMAETDSSVKPEVSNRYQPTQTSVRK